MAAHPLYAQAAAHKPKVAIKTARGTIVVELENRKAPITTVNFLHYVTTEKFDNGEIYRASRTPRRADPRHHPGLARAHHAPASRPSPTKAPPRPA
ncbi:MAG: peptidylprolyl isomerase [Caulobacteraceae bacterium]